MDEVSASTTGHNGDDFLWRQLKSVPAFRALLRAVEARFYLQVELPHPILDLGCGDGRFAQMTFDEPIDVGIDLSWDALYDAQRGAMYSLPLQAPGDRLPFADETFASAYSVSVLEHIPEVQAVLNEVGRVLQDGAPFVITVPSHYFSQFLGGAGFFNGLGLESMAEGYRRAFNRLARHAHNEPPEVWAGWLAEAGFEIERWQYYFSRDALRALEVGHVQGAPSAVLHALTGHYILGPWEGNLKYTERWVRPYYEEPFPAQGAFLYFVARKRADGPVQAVLPPARPYAVEELKAGESRAAAVEVIDTVPEPAAVEEPEADVRAGTAAANDTGVEAEPAMPGPARLIVPALLVGLTVLFAYFGQAALRATPDEPAAGLRWLAISAIPLLLLLWQQQAPREGRTRRALWPDWRAIETRRWYYLPALALAFLAPRLVATGAEQRPWLALPVWLISMVVATYALGVSSDESRIAPTIGARREKMTDFRAAVLLFLIALLPRIYELASLPFVLSGTEASIGLEALNVLNGAQQNPFTSGWLTNPTLPFFALALPMGLFGPSTEAIRLFSALVGAITVPVLFLIGKQLYGRVVGLAAAVLLLGSHFHVHFSRMGLTNVWDALGVLLALGLIAIAWQREPSRNRNTWLAAGTAVGFCAYLYTSAHLLPLILLALGMLLLILDFAGWRRQWSGVLAMLALALVVALPILLHYWDAPELYMERATRLGILANQSDWLAQQAALTNSSQIEVLLGQFSRAALAFNATLDQSSYYGAYLPFLNFIAGMLAAIGFLLAVVRLRQIRYGILVAWISVTVVFAGTLLDNPPSSHRYIIAAPAVMLLAAQALAEFARALTIGRSAAEDDTGTRARLIYLLIPLIIAAALALYDAGYYFGPYRSNHHYADRNTEIADRIAEYLNELDGEWSAYFYGPPSMYVDFPTIPFLARDFVKGDNLFDVPESGMTLPLPEGGRQTFIFLPERYMELEPLRAAYPAGRELSIGDGYYTDPLFYVYEISDVP